LKKTVKIVFLKIKNIPIDSIDYINNDFKISRPLAGDVLRESVLHHGILDPPVLLKGKDTFTIISGHNRLRILKEENILNAPVHIIESLSPESFINYAYLKNFRTEIGPIGKLKFINVINEKLYIKNDVQEIFRKINLPADVIDRKSPWDKFTGIPRILQDYIDTKDVSFKVIKNLLLLNEQGILLLTKWLMPEMRINIFKGVIDLLTDIFKRDRSFAEPGKIDISNIQDKRRRESELFKELYKIRYPEYTSLKSEADRIIHDLKKNKIDIEFPEFFENDEIGIVLKIKKREGADVISERLKSLDLNLVDELLKML
jgi:hypothetical protein